MTLVEAVHLWRMHGWLVEERGIRGAIMIYDDGGWAARAFDRQRGKGYARAALYIDIDGRVRCRLLSKWTTNGLHWIRYLTMKYRTAQLEG